MKTKKITLIATAFAPEKAIGSIRTTKLVKYLVRANYEITVISPQLNENTQKDASLDCLELKKIKHINISHSSLFKKLFLKKRNSYLEKSSTGSKLKVNSSEGTLTKIKGNIKKTVHFLYTIIRNLDWYIAVRRDKQIKELTNSTSMTLISSYPSLSTHWISQYLSKKFGYVWIADFRDPINYESNSNFVTYKLNTIIQNRIVKNATYVTYISQGVYKKLEPKKSFNDNKFKFIPNGFDYDDLKTPSSPVINEVLNMSYVGGLYGGERDMSILFQAIRDLIDSNKINSKDVVFIYAGKEFNVLQRLAQKYDLEDILLNKGYVSLEESILIQQNSDIALICTWNTQKDQGIMTGKVFESFLASKVILAIINGDLPDSELKQTITYVNGGFTYEEGSINKDKEYKDLCDFIITKVKEKKEFGLVKDEYNNNKDDYSYQNISSSFIKLIES